VSLLWKVDDSLPKLAIEPEALRQALSQLADNAHEAITDRGVVTLTARAVELSAADCLELLGSPRPGRHLEIAVSDTGCGLPAELRGRPYPEVFFSTKPRHRGLGLAIVQGVMQTFRGGWRFGPHPELGTTARLFVPALATEQPEPAADKAAVKGERILVVDDDPLVLQGVCRILDGAGYHVQGALGAREGLASYQTASYRLVLSDVSMPDMDGFQMVRRLVALDPRVNVVFISSLSPDYEADQEMLDRFSLLRKPFDSHALLQKVQAACQSQSCQSLGGMP
jgi:CheY-like chemotaxis protein